MAGTKRKKMGIKESDRVVEFPDYPLFFEALKAKVHAAQIRASLSVNQELLLLYYEIGLELDNRCRKEAWGTSIVDRLSRDLTAAFPGVEGFSPRNMRRMRAFYCAYPLDEETKTAWAEAADKRVLTIWPPVVAKLPWAHNVLLLEKVKNLEARQWYAQAALEYGWSRNILAMQIESSHKLLRHSSLTNFRSGRADTQGSLYVRFFDPYSSSFGT